MGSLLASGGPKPRGRAHARRAARANTRANASRVASGRASPPGVPAPAAGETIDVMDNLEDSESRDQSEVRGGGGRGQQRLAYL